MASSDEWRVNPADLPFGVLGLSVGLTVAHTNAAAAQLFGRSTAALVGVPVTSLVQVADGSLETLLEPTLQPVLLTTASGRISARSWFIPASRSMFLFASPPAAELADLNHRVSQPLTAALGSLELMLLIGRAAGEEMEQLSRVYDQVRKACAILQRATVDGPA